VNESCVELRIGAQDRLLETNCNSVPNYFCQAVDWWSVGVLTYELLTGASPFTVDGEKNTQQEISRYSGIPIVSPQ